MNQRPIPITRMQVVARTQEIATTSPPGCFVEIGVWEGGTASYLFEIAQNQSRELHLFDYFDNQQRLEKVKQWCRGAILHPGKFPDTWDDKIPKIAYCFYDTDDVEGAKYLLKILPRIMVPNGIVVFVYLFDPERNSLLKGIATKFITADGLRYPFLENGLDLTDNQMRT